MADIEIQGEESIIKALDSIADIEAYKEKMGVACALVERTAKEKAPKGDGELRRSITSKVDTDMGDVVGVVYTPLEYAPYVEYGTGLFAEGGKGRQDVPWVYVEGNTSSTKSTKSYTEQEAKETVAFLQSKGLDARYTYGEKPQPYLRPALNENREQIKRILGEVNNNG